MKPMEGGRNLGSLSNNEKKSLFFFDVSYQCLPPPINVFHYSFDKSFQRCFFKVQKLNFLNSITSFVFNITYILVVTFFKRY